MDPDNPAGATEVGAADPVAEPDPVTAPHVETIQRLFRELLEREQIGPTDNFFERGGNSLLAARLLWSIQNTFHVEVPMRAMFDDPTPSGLARVVEELVRAEFEATAPADPGRTEGL